MMKKERYIIDYLHYEGIDELPIEDQRLAEAAIDAMTASYAPYSHFNVGAAVRLDNGTIILGSNQENIASPSGLCAERTALFTAGSMYPKHAVMEIAIAGGPNMTLSDDAVTPCGACRQVMNETQKRSGRCMSVLLIGRKEVYKFNNVQELMPFSFEK